MLRALGVLRGETAPDQSTKIAAWAAGHAAHVVGYASDAYRSGGSSPLTVGRLADWTERRAEEFDVIVVTSLDRLTRDTNQLTALLDWARDHGKRVVSVDGAFDTHGGTA